MDVLHTLAYSFVDRDRLFLRPTVRGRGVNGSIEKTRLASCQRCATSRFMISRGLSLAWYYSLLSLLPQRYSSVGSSRAGRARTSTTSGDAPSASWQKKPTSPVHKSRCSSSVGLQSVSFVLIMATSSARKRLSVGIYPLLSRTCVHGGNKRKITRRS
jgi:hypothetical protein